MAANQNPIFIIQSNKGSNGTNFGCILTTANTTRDLSTTANGQLLFSASTDGSRIDSIVFTHASSAQTQTSVAAVGRIFLCTSAAGANPLLIAEQSLPAIAPSASAVGQSQTFTFSTPLFLKSGMFLWATISATQTSGAYHVTCNGGDY